MQITPDYMPGVLLSGATDYSLGSYQQAESNLIRFLVRFPGHAYARRVLAATQIQLKQPDKALATLAPVLSADPLDAQALTLAGEASLLKHELTQATEYFTKSVAIDPKNAQAQTQLGLSLLASGEGQLAIAELGKAATLGSDQGSPDILLVMAFLDRKEYDQALAATDAMEKKLKKSALSRTMRGSAFLGKNDLANARASFEQALAIDPAFIPAATSLAQLDIHDNKPESARKRFESILEKDKNNLQAMMALAELAASNNREKEYVDWLEKAAKLNPKAVPPRVVLARHYLTLNEPQKAQAIASELVNVHPESLDALDLLGTVQLALNDKAGAVSTFTRMTQKAAQSTDALQRLAVAQIANNQLADARITLQKALKINPNHQPSLDALIRLNMREGKPEAALQIARQVETASPQSPFGFEREGDILLNQKQPALAAKAYEQAFARGAGSTGLIKLHRAMTLSGSAAAADQQLNGWIKQHPDDLAALGYAAENAMAGGKNKEAIAYYEAILKQAPQNATVLNNLAGLYQREADSRALPTAEQALKLDPESPAVQDTLGWILVEQGQAKRGLELLGKALAQIPKNPSIRYHYAVALARTGDQAGARKRFELLIKDFPGSPEALSAKAQLQPR
jgi:putative PEP-CTERM system TPR-repeat lipoprotein